MEKSLLVGPFLKRSQLQNEALLRAASDLVEKLQTLPWKDRDICFKEWDALVNVLNTGESANGIKYVNGKVIENL